MATKSNIIRCPMCGKTTAESQFYQSKSPLYKSNYGRMVFCKDCVRKQYDLYYNSSKDIRSAIYITCLKFDIPFSESDFEGALKELDKKPNAHALKTYITKLNSLGGKNNGLIEFDASSGNTYDDSVNNKINSDSEIDFNKIEQEIEVTDEDKQTKSDVIRLMGYDPFAGYSKFDQKFLYNDFITYLDEDTLDDNFKLSQIIQLVNNNNQIRKIDLVIARMSSNTKALMANQGDVKSLQQTKYQIVQATDKIAKENSISVKNRGDKKAGKSTLTYMMKNLRELNFEDAEQDYYDQNKAYGMKRVADISNKSILEQLQFDENDYVDMIKEQREIIQQLREKIEDIEEENRTLYVQIGQK